MPFCSIVPILNDLEKPTVVLLDLCCFWSFDNLIFRFRSAVKFEIEKDTF